ncbi:sialate O-acetylesterase [Escherichia coli]
MPGNFTVKVSGGTAAFLEALFPPADAKGGMTFSDCLISFNTRESLWVRSVAGNPNVEITGAGISSIMPLSADVAGSAAPSDWNNAESQSSLSSGTTGSTPSWYYVIAIAGQSNASSYGEGLPLPDSYDRPHPRIMQLARRKTQTPGGIPCKYNDIIPADHCLHDVQDMSKFNHPRADLDKGQYGCVGQGLHIAKKLLAVIPPEAGILLVPCARGGSAFTTGAIGTFDPTGGAAEASLRWGEDTPLYQDLISRTKAALDANPDNVLLAVLWVQGEGDLTATPAQHGALFTAMVKKFRADLTDYSKQCSGGAPGGVPWLCGDTTYDWKEKNPAAYDTVYNGYKNREAENIHFVPLMHDASGNKTPTNFPEQDPDLESSGYYGAASRSEGNWTTASRATHFSSWARRLLVSDRFATAILEHSGRTLSFLTGQHAPLVQSEEPLPGGGGSGKVGASAQQDPVPVQKTTLMAYQASVSGGGLVAQGWRAADGSAKIIDDATATAGKAMRVEKTPGKKDSWKVMHSATAENAAALLNNGGEIAFRFRIPDDVKLAANRYAMALYWPVSALPSGVTMNGTSGNNMLAAFYVQTDTSDINLMYHKASNAAGNQKLGTFGAFDHQWHTVAFRFAGGNSLSVVPVIDGKDQTAFTLEKCPATGFAADTLLITDITGNQDTYPVLVESITVNVNAAKQ